MSLDHLLSNQKGPDILRNYLSSRLENDTNRDKRLTAHKILDLMLKLAAGANNGSEGDLIDDLVHMQGTGQLFGEKNIGKGIPILNNRQQDMTKPARIRVGIVVYMPYRADRLYEMEVLSYMHPSWHYVTTHSSIKKSISIPGASEVPDMSLDLIIYCHPKACCSAKKANCKLWTQNAIETNQSGCYYHPEEGFPEAQEYGYYNTFAFLRDDNFKQRAMKYDWLIRSDTDVFIGPAILGWLPHFNFMTGSGGYASEFNRKRLPEVASRLHLKHHGMTNIGSTWYGKPELFIKISELTLKYCQHFFNNEFNKTLNGIQDVMNKSAFGEWPTWWRPVSLLYAGEVVINDIFPDFNSSYIAQLDFPSSSKLNILSYPHMHCWHGEEEFQKFKFVNKLRDIINGGKDNRTSIYKSDRDVSSMTVQDYCTFIAWNAVANNKNVEHLQK
ncbi:unnamed protein product, partial [Owenia fusiformis]